jgi:hypothetical protein
MIGWAIDANEIHRAIRRPMKNRHTKEELAFVNRTHFEDTITHAHEHPARLAIGREPGPEEILPHFKTSQLRIREVPFDGFVK